jgi:hypothetical protein
LQAGVTYEPETFVERTNWATQRQAGAILKSNPETEGIQEDLALGGTAVARVATGQLAEVAVGE